MVPPPPEPAVVDGTSVVAVAVAVAVACPPPAPVLTIISDSLQTTNSALPVAGALLADLTRLAGTVSGPSGQASSRSDDALCERSAEWRSNSLVRLDIAGTGVGVWVRATQDNGQQAQDGVAEVSHDWIFL